MKLRALRRKRRDKSGLCDGIEIGECRASPRSSANGALDGLCLDGRGRSGAGCNAKDDERFVGWLGCSPGLGWTQSGRGDQDEQEYGGKAREAKADTMYDPDALQRRGWFRLLVAELSLQQ